jgi:hypothetical protein
MHPKTRIFINNFNRLTSTKGMVEYLMKLNNVEVTVVDNNSTYPPLLEWYTNSPCAVNFLGENYGPRAIFDRVQLTPGERFVATDSDLGLDGIPVDMIEKMHEQLDRWTTICKVGLSLEINDLPDDGVLAGAARHMEAGNWVNRIGEHWNAPIDTTFALYRCPRVQCIYGPAIRLDRPYTAKHLPWYTVPGKLSDEEKYYLETMRYGSGVFYSQRHKEILGIP